MKGAPDRRMTVKNGEDVVAAGDGFSVDCPRRQLQIEAQRRKNEQETAS
jgi:hypothetical protein